LSHGNQPVESLEPIAALCAAMTVMVYLGYFIAFEQFLEHFAWGRFTQ
jgi:hypothetical protein